MGLLSRRKKTEAADWVEVEPGQNGTPEDEFTSFTYWEPSKSLLASLVEDARESGDRGLPDVRMPDPLDEPDGLTQLRHLVIEACQGRKAAAVDLFIPTRERIALVTAKVRQGAGAGEPTTANDRRDLATYAKLLPELNVLESQMARLEDALQARLGRLISHFDRMAGEFTHELKKRHAFADLLSTRWDPAPLVIDDEIRVFGQDTAGEQIAALRQELEEQTAEARG